MDGTSTTNAEKKYKVVVIGDAGVGKTALTFRYSEGIYRDNLTVTIGVDIRVKKVIIDDEIITLNIWDTAGLERNRQTLSSHYFRGVNAVVLVYDVTSEKSFINLRIWLEEMKKNCSDDVIKVLIGNKCDEKAVVNRQIAQMIADSYGMPLFETSAKLDSETDNIEAIFLTIAHKLKANSNLIVNNNAIKIGHAAIGDTPPSSSSSCRC